MKRIIITTSIYLTGCVFGYMYVKHNFLTSGAIKTWTIGNRNVSIFLSLGSWCTVAAMGIVDVIQSSDNSTPAKW